MPKEHFICADSKTEGRGLPSDKIVEKYAGTQGSPNKNTLVVEKVWISSAEESKLIYDRAEERDAAFEMMRLALNCINDYNNNKHDKEALDAIFLKWQSVYDLNIIQDYRQERPTAYKFIELIEHLSLVSLQYANQVR